jgi:hypothetical protein
MASECEPCYLTNLSNSLHILRDNIRDTLFTKQVSNFMVLCPNKMIGTGPWNTSICNEDLSELAALWGDDPVHPTGAADKKMGNTIIANISDSKARYTNPPPPAKKN